MLCFCCSLRSGLGLCCAIGLCGIGLFGFGLASGYLTLVRVKGLPFFVCVLLPCKCHVLVLSSSWTVLVLCCVLVVVYVVVLVFVVVSVFVVVFIFVVVLVFVMALF